MMMKTKFWLAGLSALGLVALALPSMVIAQHGEGRSPRKEMVFQVKGYDRTILHEKLDLTEEQQEQVDTMRLEFQQGRLRLEGQVSAAEAELEALLLDPEASRSAVLSAGSTLQELRTRASTARLEHRMDFRELLTPEQRSTLVKMDSRRGGMRGLHRGHQMRGHRTGHHHRGQPCGERNCFRWFENDPDGKLHEIDVERVIEGSGDEI